MSLILMYILFLIFMKVYIFVTPYIAMRCEIIPKQLLETLSISTPVREFVLDKIVYHDCVMSLYQKDSTAY